MIEFGSAKNVVPPRPTFDSIVGQDSLKEALSVVAVDDGLGGLLIQGEKGTAKSTAVRALSGHCPSQTVVADCPYGCAPDSSLQCESCESKSSPETTERAVPLVTVPLGATRDRLVGTLSIEDALAGTYSFDPGLLARANRGFLYVDEVNLLADHLVDLLLDVSASGINHVERDGVSVSHPAAFTLIGTMNPEEGDLRPQLRDRFDLQVTVTACEDLNQRTAIIERALENGQSTSKREQTRVSDELATARECRDDVQISSSQLRTVAQICRDAAIDGHRGDIAIARTAITLASLDSRSTVIDADVQQAAEYCLPHRLHSDPLDKPQSVSDLLEDSSESEQSNDSDPEPSGEPETENAASTDNGVESNEDDDGEETEGQPVPRLPGTSVEPPGTADGPSLPSLSESSPIDNEGSRAQTDPVPTGDGPRHRATPDAPSDGGTIDTAASVRAAARSGRVAPSARDLRYSVRADTSASLVVFVVDASASMRSAMSATKAIVLELLDEAYTSRDRVAVIAVAGESAGVLVPPTDSVAQAARHLKELPSGNQTPLADGLATAVEVIDRAAPATSCVVCLTDGRATGTDERPLARIRSAAEQLGECADATILVGAGNEHAGALDAIATQTDADRCSLAELSATRIDSTVGSC
ncbi:VWA domain-containing protein [Halocatena halophila]|uniref:VWA domain-containing protein n=1 Tax=Halocatena halophila TaxID=2814576 RepID=UPI002ED0E8AE